MFLKENEFNGSRKVLFLVQDFSEFFFFFFVRKEKETKRSKIRHRLRAKLRKPKIDFINITEEKLITFYKIFLKILRKSQLQKCLPFDYLTRRVKDEDVFLEGFSCLDAINLRSMELAEKRWKDKKQNNTI